MSKPRPTCAHLFAHANPRPHGKLPAYHISPACIKKRRPSVSPSNGEDGEEDATGRADEAETAKAPKTGHRSPQRYCQCRVRVGTCLATSKTRTHRHACTQSA